MTTTQQVPVLEPGVNGSVIRVIGTGYLPESGARFGVGCVREGESAVQRQYGPEVPGPWAYAYGLCSVIDNHGGTKAESERMQAEGREHTVNIGDVVEIAGNRYTVDFSRMGKFVDKHNVSLTLVEQRPARDALVDMLADKVREAQAAGATEDEAIEAVRQLWREHLESRS